MNHTRSDTRSYKRTSTAFDNNHIGFKKHSFSSQPVINTRSKTAKIRSHIGRKTMLFRLKKLDSTYIYYNQISQEIIDLIVTNDLYSGWKVYGLTTEFSKEYYMVTLTRVFNERIIFITVYDWDISIIIPKPLPSDEYTITKDSINISSKTITTDIPYFFAETRMKEKTNFSVYSDKDTFEFKPTWMINKTLEDLEHYDKENRKVKKFLKMKRDVVGWIRNVIEGVEYESNIEFIDFNFPNPNFKELTEDDFWNFLFNNVDYLDGATDINKTLYGNNKKHLEMFKTVRGKTVKNKNLSDVTLFANNPYCDSQKGKIIYAWSVNNDKHLKEINEYIDECDTEDEFSEDNHIALSAYGDYNAFFLVETEKSMYIYHYQYVIGVNDDLLREKGYSEESITNKHKWTLNTLSSSNGVAYHNGKSEYIPNINKVKDTNIFFIQKYEDNEDNEYFSEGDFFKGEIKKIIKNQITNMANGDALIKEMNEREKQVAQQMKGYIRNCIALFNKCYGKQFEEEIDTETDSDIETDSDTETDSDIETDSDMPSLIYESSSETDTNTPLDDYSLNGWETIEADNENKFGEYI